MSTPAKNMRFCNRQLWQIRTRSVSPRVTQFARAWALEMQPILTAGTPIGDIAWRCAEKVALPSLVDYELLHQAVCQLNECWYWGEALFRWHNTRAVIS